MNAGESVSLKYTAFDNKKNEIKGDWQLLAHGGTINNQNQYIAGDDAGSYSITILEKKSGLSKNIDVEINKPVVYQIAVTPNPVVLAVGSKQKLNIKLLKNNRERLTWEWEFKITPSAGKMDRNIYIAPDKPGKYSITIIYNQTQFQKIECIVPVEVIPIQNEIIKEESKEKEESKDKKESKEKEESKTEIKNQKIKEDLAIENSSEELFENMLDEFPIEDNDITKETENQNITANKKQDITKNITENQTLSNTQATKNIEKTIQQNTEKQNIEEKTINKEEIQPLKEDKQLEKKQDFIDIDTKIAYIKIYPEQLQLGCGETSQLVAYAYNAQNRKVTGDIQWSATGGRITYAGVYIAGRNPGLFQIQARVKQNPNIMASILVNVQAKQIKSQENTQNKSTFMNEGYAWGVALKNGTSTQEQLIKYIAEDLIYKSSLSIYQFRQGFIKGYDALGNSRYQTIWSQSLLTLGYSYGKYLRIGTVSENQIVNFMRFTLKRFSMHDQDTFKKGFMQGYAYSGSEYIYQQLLKKAN